jgi:hypothetical protein
MIGRDAGRVRQRRPLPQRGKNVSIIGRWLGQLLNQLLRLPHRGRHRGVLSIRLCPPSSAAVGRCDGHIFKLTDLPAGTLIQYELPSASADEGDMPSAVSPALRPFLSGHDQRLGVGGVRPHLRGR